MTEKIEKKNGGAATVGYAAKLWQKANAPRCSMNAAEDKYVVLDLIFLKYESDAFEKRPAYARPGQLFYSTQMPGCLWFLIKNHHYGIRPASPNRKLAA